jgi:hypothetical protein
MSGRTKHPSKEIEAALDYAESEGWRVENRKGHAWGCMLCPWNDGDCRCNVFCTKSIWSTPRVPEDIAEQVRRAVDGCVHVKERREAAARKAAEQKQGSGRDQV